MRISVPLLLLGMLGQVRRISSQHHFLPGDLLVLPLLFQSNWAGLIVSLGKCLICSAITLSPGGAFAQGQRPPGVVINEATCLGAYLGWPYSARSHRQAKPGVNTSVSRWPWAMESSYSWSVLGQEAGLEWSQINHSPPSQHCQEKAESVSSSDHPEGQITNNKAGHWLLTKFLMSFHNGAAIADLYCVLSSTLTVVSASPKSPNSSSLSSKLEGVSREGKQVRIWGLTPLLSSSSRFTRHRESKSPNPLALH